MECEGECRCACRCACVCVSMGGFGVRAGVCVSMGGFVRVLVCVLVLIGGVCS